MNLQRNERCKSNGARSIFTAIVYICTKKETKTGKRWICVWIHLSPTVTTCYRVLSARILVHRPRVCAMRRRGVTRVGTHLCKTGITAIVHFIVSDVIGPRNGVRRVSSANKLRRDASRVCTARIARVYLHRNGTTKGLYILLDVGSGRERRDEDGCELIKQNSRTVSLGSTCIASRLLP